jgi:ABC-type multidrug transport system permease subunit
MNRLKLLMAAHLNIVICTVLTLWALVSGSIAGLIVYNNYPTWMGIMASVVTFIVGVMAALVILSWMDDADNERL